MKPYYSDYVSHYAREFFRCKGNYKIETQAERIMLVLIQKVWLKYPEKQKRQIEFFYTSDDDSRKNWNLGKDFEKDVAKARGLI